MFEKQTLIYNIERQSLVYKFVTIKTKERNALCIN